VRRGLRGRLSRAGAGDGRGAARRPRAAACGSGADLGANQAAEHALGLAEGDRLVLPCAMTGSAGLLEALPRHQTAHAALLADILDVLHGASPAARRQSSPPAQGQTVARLCTINPRTTEEDIDAVLVAMTSTPAPGRASPRGRGCMRQDGSSWAIPPLRLDVRSDAIDNVPQPLGSTGHRTGSTGNRRTRQRTRPLILQRGISPRRLSERVTCPTSTTASNMADRQEIRPIPGSRAPKSERTASSWTSNGRPRRLGGSGAAWLAGTVT
jgi:hypothetical protein